MSDLVGGVAFVLGGLILWGFAARATDGLEDYFFYVGTVTSLFGLMLLLLVAFTA